MQEYYATMPWLAVPPEHRELLKALPGKYGVMSVPTLLVFSPEGELLTRAGVHAVQQDPAGAGFPWKGAQPGLMAQAMKALPMVVIGCLFYLLATWVTSFLKK
jgi:hypothetical protein